MKNKKYFSQHPEQEKSPLEAGESIYSEIQVKKEEDSSPYLSNPYLEETQRAMNHGKQDPEYRDYNFLDPLTYHKIFTVEKSPYLEQINVLGDGLIYSKQATSPILRGTVIGPALAIEYTEEFLKSLYGENIDLVDLQYSLPAQPAEKESAENSSEVASSWSNVTAKQKKSPKIRLPTENMLQFAREKKVGLCPVYFVNHRSNVLIQLGFSPIGVAPEKIQKYLAGSREGYILYKKTVYSVVNGKVHVLKNNVSKRIQEIFPPVMTEKEDIEIEALQIDVPYIDVPYKDEFDLLEHLNPSAQLPKRHNVEYDLMEYPPRSEKYLTMWVSIADINPGDEITTSYGAHAQIDFQKAQPNAKRSMIFDLEDEAIPRFTVKIEEDENKDLRPDTRILENMEMEDIQQHKIVDPSESEKIVQEEKADSEINEHYLFVQASEEFSRSLIKLLNGKLGSEKMKHLFNLPEKEFKNLLQCYDNQFELCNAFSLNQNNFADAKKAYPEKAKLLKDKTNFKGKYFSLAAEISKIASERFSAEHQSDELVKYIIDSLKTFSKEFDKIKCLMSLSPKIFKRVIQNCHHKTDLCHVFGLTPPHLVRLEKNFPQNYEILKDKSNFKSDFKSKSLSTSMVDILFQKRSAISLNKKLIIQRLTAQMQAYSDPVTAVKELLGAKEENFRALLKFFDNRDDFIKSLGLNRLVYDDIVNSDCTLAQQINYNLSKGKNNFKSREQPVALDLSFLNRSTGEELIKNLQQNVATYLQSDKRMTATEKINYFFGLFRGKESKFVELLAQFNSSKQLLKAFNLNFSAGMSNVKTAAPNLYRLMKNKVFYAQINEDDSDLSLADPHKKINT